MTAQTAADLRAAIHTVTAEADPDDGTPSWFGLTFACSGGPEDECHQWCAEGCEEECPGPVILGGATVELVAQAPVNGHRWAPMPPHGESCRIADWLDACDADYTYAGDDEPLRVGTHRIETEWTGDDYVWRYWDAPEPVHPAAARAEGGDQ